MGREEKAREERAKREAEIQERDKLIKKVEEGKALQRLSENPDFLVYKGIQNDFQEGLHSILCQVIEGVDGNKNPIYVSEGEIAIRQRVYVTARRWCSLVEKRVMELPADIEKLTTLQTAIEEREKREKEETEEERSRALHEFNKA